MAFRSPDSFQCSLSTAPIVPANSLFADDEGAQCQFLGAVRHLEDNTLISGIDYSAYHPMADQELRRLCERALREKGAHRVEIQHRLGFVPAGEPSILIRIWTKHSAEAFELCRWYLREIKTSIPIWKRIIPA